MPPWLPPVLASAAIMLAGQAVALAIVVRVMGVRLDEHDRRIAHVEVDKLSTALHVAAESRILADISQVRHRVAAVEQREIARAEK